MTHPDKDDLVLPQNRSDSVLAFPPGIPAAADFVPPGLPIDEWSFFRHAHPHALLIGSAAQAIAAVARLRRDLRTPLVHWHPSAAGEPTQATGTLIVWEVDALDRMQQERLLVWMGLQRDLQVISVARYPVFPLVLEGAFLDTLYYRLNTVCLLLPQSLNADDALTRPARR